MIGSSVGKVVFLKAMKKRAEKILVEKLEKS